MTTTPSSHATPPPSRFPRLAAAALALAAAVALLAAAGTHGSLVHAALAPPGAAPSSSDEASRPSEALTLPVASGAANVSASASASAAPSSSPGRLPDGRVVLNLATEDDLRTLPGIGPAKARAILAVRAKLGKFTRVEQLRRVKGVGPKLLARLRPKVVLDP
jgi:competence protein ComEA